MVRVLPLAPVALGQATAQLRERLARVVHGGLVAEVLADEEALAGGGGGLEGADVGGGDLARVRVAAEVEGGHGRGVDDAVEQLQALAEPGGGGAQLVRVRPKHPRRALKCLSYISKVK